MAVLAVLLVAALWSGSWSRMEAEVGVETGDGAVNALAIIDAADGQRIHGNYSRWGFFHPGPAFFYVQAAGEWLLCRRLAVIKHPATAHHLAIMGLNAVLLVAALAFWPRTPRGVWFLPSAVALLALHAALINRELGSAGIVSTWPPHMLFAPFVCFLVASGAFAAGDWKALPWCFACGGLLAHGHAAQGMFVGPLFVFAAVRHGWNVRRKAFAWQPARAALIVSAVVLAAFLVPLAIDLLHGADSNVAEIWRQWRAPDPYSRRWVKALICLFSYYAYIGNQEEIVQTLSAATEAEFARRWLPLAVWAAVHGWVVFAVVRNWRARAADPLARFERELVCLLVMATGLTLFWMKVQMGQLLNFNSFFAYGLPLIGGWLFLGDLTRRLPVGSMRWAVCGWGVTAVVIGFSAPHLSRGLGGNRAIAAVVATMKAEHPEALEDAVLTFRHDDWPLAATLLLEAVRQGIGVRATPEWRFMWDAGRTMDPARRPGVVWFLEPGTAGPGMVPVPPDRRIRFDPGHLQMGRNTIPLTSAGLAPFVVHGFSEPGGGDAAEVSVWTVGRVARMDFRLPPGATAAGLAFDLEPGRISPAVPTQRLTISWNGRTVAEKVIAGRETVRVRVSEWDEPPEGIHELRFDTPDAISPRRAGLGADYRELGLIVHAITIDVE